MAHKERIAHKGVLKNSTRIDEENKSNATGTKILFFVKTVRDLKYLTGTGESELEF